LLIAVLVVLFADEPRPFTEELELEASALLGGLSMLDDGVNITEVVVALDPAEADPEDENEFEAPGPDDPEEAFAWMYRFARVFGFCWKFGSASRIT
jgi:hypothetical protein